jgi:class I fructose-bisphosphate aldolase
MSVLAADGRALIVAMDHARTHGVIEGLEDPGKVINAVIEGGADGIMTTYGVMKKYRNLIAGRVPVALRLDGGPSLYREDWLAYTEWSLLHSVEDALMLGASSVVLMAFIGIEVELRTLEIVASVASECMQANLPLLVEALPLSQRTYSRRQSPAGHGFRRASGLRARRRLYQDLLHRHAGRLSPGGGQLPCARLDRRRPRA